jgi:hypothetical protein
MAENLPPIAPTISAETGKPDVPPVVPVEQEETTDTVDKEYWERCLADAERAEHDFRQRGREIIKIYRNEAGTVALTGNKKKDTGIVFNVLFSNTEVMLPNIYAIPPTPVVRSRFVKKSAPPIPMPPPMAPPPSPSGFARPRDAAGGEHPRHRHQPDRAAAGAARAPTAAGAPAPAHDDDAGGTGTPAAGPASARGHRDGGCRHAEGVGDRSG